MPSIKFAAEPQSGLSGAMSRWGAILNNPPLRARKSRYEAREIFDGGCTEACAVFEARMWRISHANDC